jgi:hypothetical protein
MYFHIFISIHQKAIGLKNLKFEIADPDQIRFNVQGSRKKTFFTIILGTTALYIHVAWR